MAIIGLTGNFGMGKSTALQLFSQLGAFTFDVDDFVHDLLAIPAIIKRISAVLGKEVLIFNSANTTLNKKHVADIIFENPVKRNAIEKIIHPEVLKTIKIRASEILRERPSAIIVFEVPLLFEAGYEKIFDKTVVVYCKRDKAVKRLSQKGFSRHETIKRMRSQMAITDKKKLADYLIDNNKSIKETESQIRQIFEILKAPCSRHNS